MIGIETLLFAVLKKFLRNVYVDGFAIFMTIAIVLFTVAALWVNVVVGWSWAWGHS